jgi:hypothetical protein
VSKANYPSPSLYFAVGTNVILKVPNALNYSHRGLEGVVLHSRVCPKPRLGELLEEAVGNWANQLEKDDD